MLSLAQRGIGVSMNPYAVRKGCIMPTYKAINLEFPDEDGTAAVSQETYAEALSKLGMTEGELLQQALKMFIDTHRSDTGRIFNYTLSQQILKDHQGNLGGLKTLAQACATPEGEEKCKSRPVQSSVAGSPKRD